MSSHAQHCVQLHSPVGEIMAGRPSLTVDRGFTNSLLTIQVNQQMCEREKKKGACLRRNPASLPFFFSRVSGSSRDALFECLHSERQHGLICSTNF